MSNIRFSKTNHDIWMFCQRCAHESQSLKEYIIHKKDQHHVRIKDTISSLVTIGIDDPTLYQELLEKFPNEKLSKEYTTWAREQIKKELAEKR